MTVQLTFDWLHLHILTVTFAQDEDQPNPIFGNSFKAYPFGLLLLRP
jgi:hypothetical protein